MPGQFGPMKRLTRQIAGALGALALAIAPPLTQAQAEATAGGLTVESHADTPSLAYEAGEGTPALWKVADEDTTIYLFGTIHALPGDTPWFNQTIATALGSADELVTEIDLGDAGSLRTAFAQKSLLPKGQTLRSLMSAKDRADYEKAMAAIGVPPAAFDSYKPWFAGLMLTMLPLLQHGYSGDAGVEGVLAAHLAPNTRTGALETDEFQLGLFASMTMEEQLSYLRSTVKAAPDMVTVLDEMVVEWLKGDAEQLAELMNAQDDDPALTERFLLSRNRTWAGWIAKRLDEPGTVFLAVGAGHLAGPGSVQDNLAKRGITSVRVQ